MQICIFILSVLLVYFLSVYVYGKKHPELSVSESASAVKKWVADGLGYEKSDCVYDAAQDVVLATALADAIQPYVKNKLEVRLWQKGFFKGIVPCVGYKIIVANQNDFPVIESLVTDLFQQRLAELGILGNFDVAMNKLDSTNYCVCLRYATSKAQLCAYNELVASRQTYVQQKLAAQVSAPVDDELETAISGSTQE